MPRPSKKPDAKSTFKSGDRVIPPNSEAVYEIVGISKDVTEAHLAIKDTNIERFRVPVDKLMRFE
jgi:hypothetical protein